MRSKGYTTEIKLYGNDGFKDGVLKIGRDLRNVGKASLRDISPNEPLGDYSCKSMYYLMQRKNNLWSK